MTHNAGVLLLERRVLLRVVLTTGGCRPFTLLVLVAAAELSMIYFSTL